MQIVINISKKLYDRYKKKDHIKRCDIDEFEKALDKCIILPKGHGRLIDADKASEVMRDIMCGTGNQGQAMSAIKSEFYTPTIIKADEEE